MSTRPGSRPSSRRLVVIGIGAGGPDQVTMEAVHAVRSLDYIVLTEKDRPQGDPLAAAREALLDRHLGHRPVVVSIPDPPRDRSRASTSTLEGYATAVTDWHAERAARYAAVLTEHPGDAGFLVWGDPALYDSTIRVLEEVAPQVQGEIIVIPGVSSLSALAARHRIVLHGIGEPFQVTTGRRLAEAVEHGQRSIAVMLNRSLDELEDIDPQGWTIWWGANLGTTGEQLVAGPLAESLPAIRSARVKAKDEAGWMMDVYLLRRQ